MLQLVLEYSATWAYSTSHIPKPMTTNVWRESTKRQASLYY